MSAALKVGDSVTWMHVVQNGCSMQFQTREGKVIQLYPSVATVKLRNGRTTDVVIKDLRLAGEKNHITELFEALTQGGGE